MTSLRVWIPRGLVTIGAITFWPLPITTSPPPLATPLYTQEAITPPPSFYIHSPEVPHSSLIAIQRTEDVLRKTLSRFHSPAEAQFRQELGEQADSLFAFLGVDPRATFIQSYTHALHPRSKTVTVHRLSTPSGVVMFYSERRIENKAPTMVEFLPQRTPPDILTLPYHQYDTFFMTTPRSETPDGRRNPVDLMDPDHRLAVDLLYQAHRPRFATGPDSRNRPFDLTSEEHWHLQYQEGREHMLKEVRATVALSSPDQINRIAKDLRQRGELAHAELLLEHAIARYKKDPYLRAHWIQTINVRGEPLRAIPLARQAVADFPRGSAAHQALVDTLLLAHKPEEAEIAIHYWLTLEPGSTKGMYYLAESHLRKEHLGEAITLIQRILSLSPSHSAALQMMERLGLVSSISSHHPPRIPLNHSA